MSARRVIVLALGYALGLVWAVAGVAKLRQLLFGTGGEELTNYVDTFPMPFVLLLSLLECFLAFLFFAIRLKNALRLGLGLLAIMFVCYELWPPMYQMPCGCLGDIKLLESLDPRIKIFLFASIHILTVSIYAGRHQKKFVATTLQ